MKKKDILKKNILRLACAGYLGAAGMLLFGVNAQAYIDPSVATYAIQAIAGIAIAVGAAVGIYFRRAKKKINEKLGVDENRNKEVESDDIEIK
ncbi:MAG: hypothetical protein J6D08_03455 [Lachnospiraceae bacterium]|nr:hypothetical protein [Lachnospiraceae bacterium]